MKFIRSNVIKNEIIIYYQNDEGKIEKIKPYNRLIPLTHKRKYKKYPADSVLLVIFMIRFIIVILNMKFILMIWIFKHLQNYLPLENDP